MPFPPIFYRTEGRGHAGGGTCIVFPLKSKECKEERKKNEKKQDLIKKGKGKTFFC